MDNKMSKKGTRALSSRFMNKQIVNSKRSQVTLWIILAIIIVAGVILVLFLKGKQIIEVIKPSMPNPKEYIDKCAKDATQEAIDILLAQGGYIQPGNYIMYKDDKIAYLCYNKNYYQTCINQEPLYTEHLEDEIKSYIKSKIEDCFYALEQEYKDRSYDVSMEDETKIEVGLEPKQANIRIEKEVTISKNEETRKYGEFKSKITSPLYDLSVIAVEIINQEAKFCYFEYLGFSLLYPSYSIEKIDIDGESKIYTIKEKASGKQLRFAVRSCAMPPGI